MRGDAALRVYRAATVCVSQAKLARSHQWALPRLEACKRRWTMESQARCGRILLRGEVRFVRYWIRLSRSGGSFPPWAGSIWEGGSVNGVSIPARSNVRAYTCCLAPGSQASQESSCSFTPIRGQPASRTPVTSRSLVPLEATCGRRQCGGPPTITPGTLCPVNRECSGPSPLRGKGGRTSPTAGSTGYATHWRNRTDEGCSRHWRQLGGVKSEC